MVVPSFFMILQFVFEERVPDASAFRH